MGVGDTVQFASKRRAVHHWEGACLAHPHRQRNVADLGVIAGSSPDAIVAAAVHNGITHLYLEAAISPLGFHGRNGRWTHRGSTSTPHRCYRMGVPLPLRLASDVDLTRQVASFHTSHGDSFDGIAADLGATCSSGTYAPILSWFGPISRSARWGHRRNHLPTIPSLVAHDYDVIAPMDYWHETKPTSDSTTARCAMDTPTAIDMRRIQFGIRRLAVRLSLQSARPSMTLDGWKWGRMLHPRVRCGVSAGCKAQAAVGASFFQWMTTTDAEWHALADFRY
jgi:hypothetical protein